MNVVGVAADADNASRIRRELDRWLIATPFDADRRGDIVLAVYEAVANAVEHAYAVGATDRVMDVRAVFSPIDRCLTVSVTDNGSWKTEVPDDRRGRGLMLVQALADEASVLDADAGTTVTMTWHQDGEATLAEPHSTAPTAHDRPTRGH